MVEFEKRALIQTVGINTNKKGRNRDVVAQYDHSCYIQKLRHSLLGSIGRIYSTSVLDPNKTLAFI